MSVLAAPDARSRSEGAAILAMMAAMAGFVGSDTFVKLATAAWPPSQIIAVRGAFAVMGGLLLARMLDGPIDWRGVRHPLVVTRGLLEAVCAWTFISALASLPLPIVTTILMASPLLLLAASAALRFERPSRWSWLAVAAGFGGVLLVVRPSSEGLGLPTGLALLSCAFVVARDLVTSRLPRHVASSSVVVSTTICVAVTGAGIGWAGGAWAPLDARTIALVAGAALFVLLGNHAIIVALRTGPVPLVTPFRYVIVPMSVALGAVVFGDVPDALALLGAAVIVLAGLVALRARASQLSPAVAGDGAAP